MTLRAYHGTTRQFSAFDRAAPAVSGSPTRTLGLFFSADPRIAAHFALRPAVLNDGYDDGSGSRLLCLDPWALDPDPFLPGAQLLTVDLDLKRPYFMEAPAFAQWVRRLDQASDGSDQVAAFRQHLQAQGHDGLTVLPWDGQGQELCVEFDAFTHIAFEPSQVTILNRQAAETAW